MVSLCTSRCRGQRLRTACAALFTRAGQTRDTRRVVGYRRRQQSHIGVVVCERDGDALCRLRHQARLADALGRLARGQDVASVSPGLGYASANTFTAMFRKALRKTLRDYFAHSTD
jgi:hypothetical protein